MNTKEVVLVVLVVLMAGITIMQAFQITNLNTKATAIATGNFGTAGTGFSSYDEMMVAHHGGAAPAAATPAQGIGGCS